LRLFSFGGYGLALAALALVVFGAIECPPIVITKYSTYSLKQIYNFLETYVQNSYREGEKKVQEVNIYDS